MEASHNGSWRRRRERPMVMTVMMVVVVVMMFKVNFTLSFNLEPYAASYFAFPYSDRQQREAYFGYAVALQLNADTKQGWVMVGAPRANSTYHDPSTIPEPGAAFACPFKPIGSTSCMELNVDPTGNDRNSSVRKKEYRDLKNHGWLGATLDSQPEHSHDRQATSVCAPLWKDQYNTSEIHMNGVCYWTIQTIGDEEIVFKKELPLVNRREQITSGTLFKAHGQAGFSVHFPNDGRKLIIGTPGLLNWTGSIIVFEDYEESNAGSERRKRDTEPPPKIPFEETPKVEPNKRNTDGLLGYAVTSGMFMDGDRELFAAGAPRSADDHGETILFEFRGYRYEQTTPRELTGQQIGEYFGAALTAADINSDGLTDLIVGAPMYSRQNVADTGRIHVYLSEEGRGLYKGPLHHYGNKVKMSRFGSTLATADLNMDGYQDIVVGAPWEAVKESEGAVYVFLGSAVGLRERHSQHISPAQFTVGLRGFGMALSRGIDVDQNGYPDFAIGSILSDKVVLVRSRPAARLTGRVLSEPRTVRFEERTQLNLTTCLGYYGHRIPSGVRAASNLTLDQLSSTPRAVLAASGNKNYIEFIEDLRPNGEVCREHVVVVKEDKIDPDLPITMMLRYHLVPTYSRLLIDQPITDPMAAHSTTTDISIAKGCKEKVCKVDLRVEVEFVDGQTAIVIGKTNRLHVTIYSQGEHAYLPSVRARVSAPLVVFPPPTHDCHYLGTPELRSSLGCKLTNPLKNTSEPEVVIFNIHTTTTTTTTTLNTNVEVEVEGEGEEQQPEDNSAALSLQLATQADLDLHGWSMEEQVSYQHKDEDLIIANDHLSFNHTFILLKKGPTPLDTVGLVVDVPMSFADGQKFVSARLGKTQFSGRVNCSWGDFNASDNPGGDAEPVVSPPVNASGGGGGGVDGGDDDNVVRALSGSSVGVRHFNCSSTLIRCRQVQCRLINWLTEAESAKVTLELEVDLTVLASHISVQGGATIASIGQASIIGLNPQLAFIGKRVTSAAAVTNIQPESLAGGSVPWWVILLAVLLGLLLVGLLAYGLYKKGFFKREKLEAMKAERARLERAPTGISNPNAMGD